MLATLFLVKGLTIQSWSQSVSEYRLWALVVVLCIVCCSFMLLIKLF